MDQILLILNCGSSSIKFEFFTCEGLSPLAEGILEEIGSGESRLLFTHAGQPKQEQIVAAHNHHDGLTILTRLFEMEGWLSENRHLKAIGHRVVHGGERFHEPVFVNDAVIQAIEDTIPLAPLHNPANLEGIRIAGQLWPCIPQVAVFDTAFHQTLPEHAFRYAIPEEWYKKYGVRRYGFHGISHAYVAKRAAEYLNQPLENLNLISLHLGNGASAAAIAAGHSIDTSMGLTPLEGLVMGTRPGDLDPGILPYLIRQGFNPETLDQYLNHQCGLKALAGFQDMRQIHQAIQNGDPRARLALEIYCYRIRKYIGAYFAVLGQVDALIFTGGIGEHDTEVRRRCCEGLEKLGLIVDADKNQGAPEDVMEIQSNHGTIKILVIATHEALEIANNVLALLRRHPNGRFP